MEPTSFDVPPKTASWWGRVRSSKALITFLALSVLAVTMVKWGNDFGGPQGLWVRFGWLAPAVSIPVHALIAVTPLPSDVFGVVNGTVYGFWLGAIFSWVAWFGASFVQYGIGRRARADFDLDGLLSRAPERLRTFPVAHPFFIIGVRFVPYVGGHLATLVPGAMAVSLRRFAWCSALAVIPQSLVTAGIGAGLLLMGG